MKAKIQAIFQGCVSLGKVAFVNVISNYFSFGLLNTKLQFIYKSQNFLPTNT